VPPVERLNHSRGCIVGTVCVRGVPGSPESRSVRRWVGGWVSGEMGSRDGDRGVLLPHMSGLGVLLKNPQV
jgi:hypothetical protein